MAQTKIQQLENINSQIPEIAKWRRAIIKRTRINRFTSELCTVIPFLHGSDLEKSKAHDILVNTFNSFLGGSVSERTVRNFISSLLFQRRTDRQQLNSASNSREMGTQRDIFVVGLGWSGSGAIVDCIADYPGVDFPFGFGEIGCFSGKYSPEKITKYINMNRCNIITCLLSFFVNNILGIYWNPLNIEGRENVTKIVGSSVNDKRVNDNIIEKYESICVNVLEKISQSRIDKNTLHYLINRSFREFFNHAKCARSNKPFLIFNNCLFGISVHNARLVSNPIVIISVRDPRDMFSSRLLEAGSHISKRAEVFVEAYNNKVNSINKYVRDSENREFIKVVEFEKFVSSDAYRNNVLEMVFCGSVNGATGQRFNPEVSMNNVGIYRNCADQSGIKFIEKNAKSLLKASI